MNNINVFKSNNNSDASSSDSCCSSTSVITNFLDAKIIFTSVKVELPQQLMSIRNPLLLAIFGSELAILTAFCSCFIVICCILHASHK